MEHRIVCRIFALAVALCLLLAFMPARPVLAVPQVSISPTSGARGTEVTVTGTNLQSYIGDLVHILFGGVEITDSPLIVSENGTFVAAFDVPHDAVSGITYITVNGPHSYQLADNKPFAIVGTDIEIDPEVGTVGNKVAVYGKGLYANGRVTFYYYSNDAREKMGVAVASPIGECTYSFIVPDSTSGSHRVVARDADGNEAKAYFDVIPSVALEPVLARIDTELAMSGTGFGYKSDVTIYLGDTTVATERTDKYGSFKTTFRVPAVNGGTYSVEVWDEDDNSDKVELTIIPISVDLNPTSGYVGTKLTVTGTGYIAGRRVTIKYDTAQVAIATVKADGTFSATFEVPISKYGDHIVTVTDGTTTRQFTFIMESEAPPVPQSLLPEEYVNVRQPVSFKWEDVTDDSLPVTYSLQIATSRDFVAASIMLEKKGLTESECTITKEEKLEPLGKEKPYYWRVKAIDSASNESEWSTAPSFYLSSSMIPILRWSLYVVIGVVVLGLGFLIFWLRRRTAA